MDPTRQHELLAAARLHEPDFGLDEADAEALRAMLAEDPQLQSELDHLERWDAMLGHAMDDVPVPGGLADRLRATVDQELAVSPVTQSGSSAPAKLGSRRGWLLGAMAVAAAVLVAIGIGAYVGQPAMIDVAQLEHEAIEVTSDLEAIAWQDVRAVYPSEAFPRQVRFKPQRWGHVRTSLDRSAVLFDLVRPGAPRAALLAMKSSAASEHLPEHPSLQPSSPSGNVCVGTWQKDGYVYSLVVSGGKARYQLFLRDSGSLTANW